MNKTAIHSFAIAAQTGHPIMLVGEPGISKTSMIRSFAKATQRYLEAPPAAAMEPPEVTGYLVPTDDGLGRVIVPPFVRRLLAAHSRTEKTMVFFDDASQLSGLMQGALMRLVLERRAGDHELPPDIWIVGAMNPPQQTAGGWELAPAWANRWVFLPWPVDMDSWTSWLLGTGSYAEYKFPILPESWRGHRLEVAAVLAAFAKRNPEKVQAMPKDEHSQAGAWASLRSCGDFLVDLLAAAISVQATNAVKTTLCAAAIGPGSGPAFMSFYKDMNLPDPEELLRGGKFELPKQDDRRYAILASVAAAVARDLTPERWAAGWEIMSMAASHGARDVAAASVRLLAEKYTPGCGLEIPPAKILAPFKPLLKAAWGYTD